MKLQTLNFTKNDLKTALSCGTFSLLLSLVLLPSPATSASVVARPSPTSTSNATTARPSVSRTNNAASRMPAIQASQTPSTETPDEEIFVEPEPEETEPALESLIDDKSSKFSTVVEEAVGTESGSTLSDNDLANMIKAQREAIEAQETAETAQQIIANNLKLGQNECDAGLRTCMAEKCGTDFTKCSLDTDYDWGNKINSCRIRTNCTGNEFTIFAAEIKADRDANAKLASFNAIISCGNRYNDCIVRECGIDFSKCLGKSAGDAAIQTCKSIADECTEQDNGLASRAMGVFGTLRQTAQEQIRIDEDRLYKLRDEMREQCTMLGALFDERTLDCVYTVNFFANNSESPYASRKAYAGSTFDCDQNWFGIDITTFKENAYRLTRSETSATSSFLGAGVGTAVGAISSGAINRAIDTKKAKDALDDAKDEYEKNYGDQSDNGTKKNNNNTNTKK